MKSHNFDTVSFASGLIITIIGVIFLIPETPSDIVNAISRMGAWFWPILLLAIGLAIIVPVLLGTSKSAVEGPDSDEEDEKTEDQ